LVKTAPVAHVPLANKYIPVAHDNDEHPVAEQAVVLPVDVT
jgi:hypothetical protein